MRVRAADEGVDTGKRLVLVMPRPRSSASGLDCKKSAKARKDLAARVISCRASPH
jgi:hypothetical protein